VSEPRDSVPDILREAIDALSATKDALLTGVREVTWGYQDLMAKGGLPTANDPSLNREAVCSEYATRAVLPRHLPTATSNCAAALEKLRLLVQLVPPLPEPPKEAAS